MYSAFSRELCIKCDLKPLEDPMLQFFRKILDHLPFNFKKNFLSHLWLQRYWKYWNFGHVTGVRPGFVWVRKSSRWRPQRTFSLVRGGLCWIVTDPIGFCRTTICQLQTRKFGKEARYNKMEPIEFMSEYFQNKGCCVILQTNSSFEWDTYICVCFRNGMEKRRIRGERMSSRSRRELVLISWGMPTRE